MLEKLFPDLFVLSDWISGAMFYIHFLVSIIFFSIDKNRPGRAKRTGNDFRLIDEFFAKSIKLNDTTLHALFLVFASSDNSNQTIFFIATMASYFRVHRFLLARPD